MPRLRSLEVFIYDALDKNSDPGDLFAIAPKLFAVKLSDFRSFHTLSLPWSQLAIYDGQCQSLDNALIVLTQALSLVNCTFHPTSDYSSSPSPMTPPLRLPHLRELTITINCDPTYPPCDLLDRLELPCLEILDIASFDYNDNEEDRDGTDIIDHLISLVLRSSCSLRTFRLHRADDYDFDLYRFLRVTPRLHTLALTGDVMDDFLRGLGGPLFSLPRLHTLTIFGKFDPHILYEVIYERFDTAAGIDSDEEDNSVTDLVPLRAFVMKKRPSDGPLPSGLAHLASVGVELFYRGW